LDPIAQAHPKKKNWSGAFAKAFKAFKALKAFKAFKAGSESLFL